MTDFAEKVADKAETAAPRRGISFADLHAGRCKFPLGGPREPAARFCGEPTLPGSAYCKKCMRIAYRRVEHQR